jgi:hypothetical protein
VSCFYGKLCFSRHHNEVLSGLENSVQEAGRFTMIRVSIALMFASSLSGPAPADETASACVDALEQLTTVQTARPIYKPTGTDARKYLDDADRPAEIARLQKIIDASCSADRDARRSEVSEADRLHTARSEWCVEERDTLFRMEQENSRDPTDIIAAQRKHVKNTCPAVPTADIWIVEAPVATPALH